MGHSNLEEAGTDSQDGHPAGIAGRVLKEWGGPSAPQTEEQLREAQIQEGAFLNLCLNLGWCDKCRKCVGGQAES